MSKQRKSINEIMTAKGVTAKAVNGNNASICPATSSTTTLPGSFRPDNVSVLVAAQIPENVITKVETRTTANSELAVAIWVSTKKIAMPTTEPNVPGINGKYPTPQVAMESAR